jgi:hypothetical protein
VPDRGRFGRAVGHDRPASGGQLRDGRAVDGYAQGDPAAGVVVADLELEPAVQLPLKILGESAQVGIDDRQLVEQAGSAAALEGIRSASCASWACNALRLPASSAKLSRSWPRHCWSSS